MYLSIIKNYTFALSQNVVESKEHTIAYFVLPFDYE